MSATAGRHSTFWVLFIWSLYLSPSNVCIGLPQDVYEKECPGIALRSLYHRKEYLSFKNRYENCTFIRDNLEIVDVGLTGSEYDFSFLDTIREVNGYVRIVGNHVYRIRLNGLRVIRGWNTYPMTVLETKRNVSLVVEANFDKNNESIGLRELQLTSLVEITRGDVVVRSNINMCFGTRKIDWRSMTKHNMMVKHTITSVERKGVCNTTCHEKCARGDRRFCWAGGREDMCQAERPCGNCTSNCSEIGCVCHSECIGGCTGSTASSCVACKNFLRSDECVENCSVPKNNRGTSQSVDPPITYIFGNRCVPECPESMVIQNGVCATACANGYKENKTNNARKCVPCHEAACPKTCNGTGDQLFGVTHFAQFNHCTIVDGHININLLWGNWRPSELEILKDVEEVTGQIEIRGWNSRLSSLSFLRNLRTIRGNGASPWSLAILITSLRALNLTSLKQITSGGVLIVWNHALCYAHTVNWTGILTNKKSEVFLDQNENFTICEKAGRICSEKCSGRGCWGPGDDNCVSTVK